MIDTTINTRRGDSGSPTLLRAGCDLDGEGEGRRPHVEEIPAVGGSLRYRDGRSLLRTPIAAF